MTSSPYKKDWVDGKTYQAHRRVWEQANGPIPEGLIVHHVNHDKRDNRLVNLALMTRAEHSAHHNNRYSRTKACVICGTVFTPHPTKRKRALTCSEGCRRICQSVQPSKLRKLTDTQEGEIRSRVEAGERRADLARECGVSPAMLTRITHSLLVQGR